MKKQNLNFELLFCFCLVDMDMSNPAVFVNAEFLKEHVGRKVRTVVQVMQSDGDKVIGKSTDEKELVVKGNPPNALSTFVEVIGIADTIQSIEAEIWTNFGDTFGMSCLCYSYIYTWLLLYPLMHLNVNLYQICFTGNQIHDFITCCFFCFIYVFFVVLLLFFSFIFSIIFSLLYFLPYLSLICYT